MATRHRKEPTSTLALKNGSPGGSVLNKENFRVNFKKSIVISNKFVGRKKTLIRLWSMNDIVKF